MVLKWLEKMSQIVQRVGGWLVVLIFVVVAVVVNLQVIFRYVINNPLSWSIELASYLMIYGVLFGGGLALIRSEYTNVEFVRRSTPLLVQWLFDLLTHLLILCFLLVATVKTEELVRQARLTTIASPALDIPMEYVYRLYQIGLGFLAFFAVVKFIQIIAAGPARKEVQA